LIQTRDKIASAGFNCVVLKFQVDLTKPDICEKEVWEILIECWNRDEKLRPNFSEISLFLKRKSLSFDKEA
jgi:hypothetical protein